MQVLQVEKPLEGDELARLRHAGEPGRCTSLDGPLCQRAGPPPPARRSGEERRDREEEDDDEEEEAWGGDWSSHGLGEAGGRSVQLLARAAKGGNGARAALGEGELQALNKEVGEILRELEAGTAGAGGATGSLELIKQQLKEVRT